MLPLPWARVCLYLKRAACISKQGGTASNFLVPFGMRSFFIFSSGQREINKAAAYSRFSLSKKLSIDDL